MSKVTVYEWNGHTWAGWWQGDQEIPEGFDKVELTQRDSSNQLYLGLTVSFDILNGDNYNDSNLGKDCLIMEGTQIHLWDSNMQVFEGFVSKKHFGANQGCRYHCDSDVEDFAAFRKQRWVVEW